MCQTFLLRERESGGELGQIGAAVPMWFAVVVEWTVRSEVGSQRRCWRCRQGGEPWPSVDMTLVRVHDYLAEALCHCRY